MGNQATTTIPLTEVSLPLAYDGSRGVFDANRVQIAEVDPDNGLGMDDMTVIGQLLADAPMWREQRDDLLKAVKSLAYWLRCGQPGGQAGADEVLGELDALVRVIEVQSAR